MLPSLEVGRAVVELLPSPGRRVATAWGDHMNCFLPWEEGAQLQGGNCFLPGGEGEQLPGNCSLPGKEVEQWPERRELSLFVGYLDLLLPEKEGEVLLGDVITFPGG